MREELVENSREEGARILLVDRGGGWVFIYVKIYSFFFVILRYFYFFIYIFYWK